MSVSVDVLGQISLGLFVILGILLAFEGFLVTLLYSGTRWGPTGKNLLKAFIGVMAFSVVVTGLLCVDAALDSRFWEKLVSFGLVTGYLFFVPVAIIMTAGVVVAVYVIMKA